MTFLSHRLLQSLLEHLKILAVPYEISEAHARVELSQMYQSGARVNLMVLVLVAQV